MGSFHDHTLRSLIPYRTNPLSIPIAILKLPIILNLNAVLLKSIALEISCCYQHQSTCFDSVVPNLHHTISKIQFIGFDFSYQLVWLKSGGPKIYVWDCENGEWYLVSKITCCSDLFWFDLFCFCFDLFFLLLQKFWLNLCCLVVNFFVLETLECFCASDHHGFVGWVGFLLTDSMYLFSK